MLVLCHESAMYCNNVFRVTYDAAGSYKYWCSNGVTHAKSLVALFQEASAAALAPAT